MAMRQSGTDAIVEALRNKSDESVLWTLSDLLYKAVPSGGNADFGYIVEAANDQGVRGRFTTNTLRLYRDTARRWPEDCRVPGISYSAHRAAETEIDRVGMNATIKMLEQVKRAQDKAGKPVTVQSVKDIIDAKRGIVRQPTSNKGVGTGNSGKGKAATPPEAPSVPTINPLEDLLKGGAKLIAAIGKETTSGDLDKLTNGLNKVLGHVERERANRNRKAAAAKKGAAPRSDSGNGQSEPEVAAVTPPRNRRRGINPDA